MRERTKRFLRKSIKLGDYTSTTRIAALAAFNPHDYDALAQFSAREAADEAAINALVFAEGMRLRVTYRVDRRTHSGWCSGHETDEEREATRVEHRVYDLALINGKTFAIGERVTDADTLHLYRGEHNSGGHSLGCCACGTRWTLVSAEVVASD